MDSSESDDKMLSSIKSNLEYFEAEAKEEDVAHKTLLKKERRKKRRRRKRGIISQRHRNYGGNTTEDYLLYCKIFVLIMLSIFVANIASHFILKSYSAAENDPNIAAASSAMKLAKAQMQIGRLVNEARICNESMKEEMEAEIASLKSDHVDIDFELQTLRKENIRLKNKLVQGGQGLGSFITDSEQDILEDPSEWVAEEKGESGLGEEKEEEEDSQEKELESREVFALKKERLVLKQKISDLKSISFRNESSELSALKRKIKDLQMKNAFLSKGKKKISKTHSTLEFDKEPLSIFATCSLEKRPQTDLELKAMYPNGKIIGPKDNLWERSIAPIDQCAHRLWEKSDELNRALRIDFQEDYQFYLKMKKDSEYQSQMHADAMFLVFYFSKRTKGVIVEAGTFEGATSLGLSLGSLSTGSEVIHFETNADYIRRTKDRLVLYGGGENDFFIQGSLREAEGMKQLKERLNAESISMVVIDADGRPCEDIHHLMPLLEEGTILVVDDYISSIAGNAIIQPTQCCLNTLEKEGIIEPFGVYGWGTWFGKVVKVLPKGFKFIQM